MISSLFVPLLLWVTVMAQYNYPPPKPRCGVNEVLNECPPHCQFEDTCSSLLDQNHNTCPNGRSPSYRCEPRCECKKGYARIDGKCQSAQNCCSNPNEELVDCSSTCEGTCENRNQTDCGQYCNKKTCRCKKGYVRFEITKCIPKEQCPKCNVNEEYTSCGSSCRETCGGENKICPLICGLGCFCKNGFVRDNKGACVNSNYCTQSKCSALAHEIYTDCINPCPQGSLCTSPCISGCICEKGYDRVGGKCVKKTPQCKGENESMQNCHGGCDPTCEQPHISCKACAFGCFCNPGYVRQNGRCIKRESCVSTTTNKPPLTTTITSGPYCRRFEIYSNCLPEKEPTCQDRKGLAAHRCRSGCTCKPGFVRDNGECKSEGQCFQGYFY